MAKFMLLYMAPAGFDEMMANATPEDMQKGMEPWMAWFGKYGSAVVDMGAPLKPEAHASQSGAAEPQSHISGYSIVEAADLAAAKAMVAEHPHFMTPEGSIEVLEVMPTPGM